jgi:hypothetical protein
MRLLNALWSQNYAMEAKHEKYELPLERDVTLITSRGKHRVRNFKATRLALNHMGRSDVKTYLIAHRVSDGDQTLCNGHEAALLGKLC